MDVYLVNFVAWTGPMQLPVYIAPLAIINTSMAVRVACLAYLELTLFIQIPLIAICAHLVNLVAWTEPMQLNVPFALLVTSSNTMGVLRVTIVLQGDIPSP
jgi:hypothetical protein